MLHYLHIGAQWRKGTTAQRGMGRRVRAGRIKKGPAQNRTFNNKCLI